MSIRHSLLALLTDQPRTPAELQHAFHDATGTRWKLNMGQVTQTLARLERDELIAPVGSTTTATGHEAISYALTDQGRETLTIWWREPVLRPESERDELVMKIVLASQRSDIDLIDVLDTQRRTVIQQIQQVTKTARELPSDLSAARLSAERRIFDLESDARFLDRAEALLNSVRKA